MRKALFDPNGGRCGGNGGRGGSMTGRGDGWLAKHLIVSNEGCGDDGLAVVMVPVKEKSKVEELTYGCSRDDPGRFRVPFEQRNDPPQQPRVVYALILDINYFCDFLVTLQNLNPMDDEPIWDADCVVALTLSSAITIPEISNEFSIKAGMPDYGKFIKELVNNKHKIEQISSALLSDESSAILQNKGPPKLGDPVSFLIPHNFNKSFSCNALTDLGASINHKLSLKTLKSTKMSIRLGDQSFQYPVGIAKNMLVKVLKFTFPVDFVILEREEDSKVPLIFGRPFLHTIYAVIRVKQKPLNLRVRTERMIFHIDSAMNHSYSNDDTCFSIDVIDEILKEDFDALLDEGSKILHSIKGTILEEKLFAEFDKFMAMTIDKNSETESNIEEPPFEKITFNSDYKIKTSLKELHIDPKLKPLLDNLEYLFLEEPSFLL
uniref:Reverse transcriptase domain-containing protein n=1 Tax=Tanacetum cinerariifolium TaxID=118510 RepID=A0A6L2MC97_TANCI|nr:reverse transcriptase domain-containing protein [Tanacetum cinerariifolium]